MCLAFACTSYNGESTDDDVIFTKHAPFPPTTVTVP